MKYDVTIVGAGPAGSTAAKFLSEKGFKVILIDKDKFPRDKPCGGGLPVRALERYGYINNEKIVEAYSYGGSAYSPSMKNKVMVKKDTPLIATTLRKKFDFELVKFAKEGGAVFQDGKCATDVKIYDDKAVVTLEDGSTIDSKIVVGADGVWSIVAEKLNLRKKGNPVGLCVLQEFKVDQNILDTYFTKARNCLVHSKFKNISGYGWVFPKKEHLNIGIGCIGLKNEETNSKINLKNHYNEYITFLKENKQIPEELEHVPLKGGALPIFPLEKTYGNRTILIGDAGGFINPLSGEGIYYAMASGEIAAQVIAEALEKGKTDEKFLSKFQARWKKEFGKDLELIFKIHKRQHKRSGEKLFEVSGKDKILAGLIMGVITGELSLRKYKWKIVRRYFYILIKGKIKI